MRSGRGADAEDEGSAPADAFAGFPTRARRGGATVARGRGRGETRAPRWANAGMVTANAVIVFSGRGGSDGHLTSGDDGTRPSNCALVAVRPSDFRGTIFFATEACFARVFVILSHGL